MSNILAIPLVRLEVETGTNEDWVDSVKFVVDTNEPELPQLDLRGIVYDMEVRRTPNDHEVVLAASTENGTIRIGQPPDVGFLILDLPLEDMRNLVAGSYVADIVGHDERYTRVIMQIVLTIVEGITKQPVNKRIVVVAA